MPSLQQPHGFDTGALKLFDLVMFGLGPVIGVGWITAVGLWIAQAGAVGAVLAFMSGGALTLLIGFCYAEMAGLVDGPGGEMAYAELAFGPKGEFAAGWLLLLTYVTVMAFEAISAGWIISALLPSLDVSAGYIFLGEAVTISNLIAGTAGAIIITLVNISGARSAGRLQSATTIGKLVLGLLVICVALSLGDNANLKPAFAGSGHTTPFGGFLTVLITTPFFLAGFNSVTQVFSERSRSISVRQLSWVLIGVLIAATTFYCLVILAVAVTLPRPDLLAEDLPAASAIARSFGPALGNVVLLAGLLGLYSVWNSVFVAASRVFAHLASRGHLPGVLAVRDVAGTPRNAVLCCALLCSLGTFAGRGAIMPVVIASGICIAATFLMVAVGVARLRRRACGMPRPFAVPGGLATASSAAAIALAMIVATSLQLWRDSPTPIPVPFVILAVWSLVGGSLFMLRTRVARAEGLGSTVSILTSRRE